jgi:hypothetical protein
LGSGLVEDLLILALTRQLEKLTLCQWLLGKLLKELKTDNCFLPTASCQLPIATPRPIKTSEKRAD